jgi:hypothetical protein
MRKIGTIALTTILIAVNLPADQRVAAQSSIPAPVTACQSNPACIVGSIIIGGILYYTVTQGGHTQTLRSEGEYLEDPEGESEDWSDYIEAGSLANAEANCRLYAQRAYAVYVRVRRVSGNRYECLFRSYRS